MRFEIVLAPQAAEDFQELPARQRSEVRHALEKHLRHQPARTSKSGIKRLRGLAKPQFRLRVGETRVFYDVTETSVEVLAIVSKERAQRWLEDEGTKEPDGGAGEGEG